MTQRPCLDATSLAARMPGSALLRLPVVAAPMFLVSSPELVIAQCRAGVVGSFPALNARTTAVLDEWITRIREAVRTPEGHAAYAVNLIVHDSNPRLRDDLEVCVRHRVPIVVTSLQPPAAVVSAVHGYGGLVFHDVTTVRHGRKAVRQGVDGLIAVTAGAGGHAGTRNPFALVKELRQLFDGIVLLGGALSTGGDVLAARAAGADLAYMGTRFIATVEANAPADFKAMIVRATSEDIVYTPHFSGVPANFLRESIVRAGLDPDELAAAPGRRLEISGETEAKAWRDVWSAGHGVASISDVPTVATLADRLALEYRAAALAASW